jgi:hypothetical protein
LIKSTFGASVVWEEPIRVCVAYVSIWGACFFNYSSDIGWDVDLERVDATISPSSMDTFMPYGQGPVVGPISVSGISIAPRTVDGVSNGNVVTVHFSILSSYSNPADFLQPAAISYILVLNNRITGCRR